MKPDTSSADVLRAVYGSMFGRTLDRESFFRSFDGWPEPATSTEWGVRVCALYARQYLVTASVGSDPARYHFNATRKALGNVGADEADTQAVDNLARALVDGTRELAVSIASAMGMPAEAIQPFSGTSYLAQRKAQGVRVLDEVVVDPFVSSWYEWKTPAQSANDDAESEHDGMLAWDAAYFDYIEGLGEADELPELLTKWRTDARNRLATWKRTKGTPEADPIALWHLWGVRAWKEPDDFLRPDPFLVGLAMVLWFVRVKRTLELDRTPDHRVHTVTVGEDSYAMINKATSAVSWAMGGAGVELDGEQYAEAPRYLTRYVPRSWALLPEDAPRPHQQTLPIETEPLLPLAVVATGSAPYIIPPAAGKLLLLFLAGTQSPGPVKKRLGDLTRAMQPEGRIQRRDYVRTVDAIHALDRLCLVLPDGTGARLWTISRIPLSPDQAHADQMVTWALGADFLEQIAHHAGKLRGRFVLNLTGAMRLPTQRTALLRHYVRAAALWNDAHAPGGAIDPRRIEPYTLEAWASIANTLSLQAVDYLKERDPKLRRKLSEDLKGTQRDLDELCDRGLVELEKKGRKELLILPPPTLVEAYDAIRRHKAPETQKPGNPK